MSASIRSSRAALSEAVARKMREEYGINIICYIDDYCIVGSYDEVVRGRRSSHHVTGNCVSQRVSGTGATPGFVGLTHM